MKCSNCGGIFHASTPLDGCAGGDPVAMSAAELLALSLDDFHRVRALALADPPTPPGADAPPSTPDPAPDAPPAVEQEPSGDAAMDGPKFRIPVGISEGVMSSKGIFSPGSLTARETPFPLMGIDKTTPEHFEAEIIGRVDAVGKDGNDWWAEGVLLGNDRGAYFAQLIADQFVKGVSADVADVIAELIAVAYDDDGFPVDVEEQYTQGVIAGFTVCPFPAFPGAYIVLVSDDAEATPPTPPTLEDPTPEQAAQAVHIVSSGRSRCGTCDESAALVAAAGPMYPPREWFENPNLDGPTPLTITEDGRIFGHMAVFGECHIGIQGKCVTAPKSLTGYSHFNRFSVQTAEGGIVATGVITLDTGHADDRERRPERVVAHYDNTGLACADVRMGDDEFGIWIAGATRPDLDELGVRKLRGSALSGDWRWIGAGMEPVAALAVNVPGFPIVKSLVADGQQVSLVAAGGLPLAQIVASRDSGADGGELAARLAVLERVTYLGLDAAKANLRARMESLA